MTTLREALGDALGVLGVRRTFLGAAAASPVASAGLAAYATGDDELAATLADADGRIGGGWGAAVLGDVLHLSSRPGGTARPIVVADTEHLWGVLDALAAHPAPATVALVLDLDLDAPVDDDDRPSLDRRPAGAVPMLDPELAAARLALVVGPGVERADALAGMRSVAERAEVAVLNTWGAKGVLRWDSPWHGGTLGLQEADVALAGLDDVDLVIASGLDPDEVATSLPSATPVLEVHPAHLGDLLARWPEATGAGTLPPPTRLYSRIAEVVQPAYERSKAPLHPARAALQCSGAGPPGALVAVDAGLAGFWIARTFPTAEPASVAVPAAANPGFAAAAALLCALDGRSALAVVDAGDGPDGVDHATAAVLGLARSWDERVAVQVWSTDGPATDAAAHAAATVEAFEAPGVTVTHVGIDGAALGELEAVAGRVVAWGGLES